MDGSKLARGERSAAFNVEGSEEFTHDLKTLTKAQFIERYESDDVHYETLLQALASGTPIMPVQRREEAEGRKKLAQMPHVSMPFKAEVKIPGKPQSSYAAQAMGDTVFVVRVEREHSSHLIIPDSAKGKSDIGIIVSFGPKAETATAIGKGNLCIFDQFASFGKEIDLVDDQGVPRQHLLLKDYDILSTLRKIPAKVEEPLLLEHEPSGSRTTLDS